MGNEVTEKYNKLNSEIESLNKQLNESTVTFSWLRGRKFKPADGSKPFTLNDAVKKLKKIDQEIHDLRPTNQSNESEYSEYLAASDKISKLANSIKQKDADSRDSKIKGFALRRFFGIPALIRSKKLESIKTDHEKDIKRLQSDLRMALRNMREEVENYKNLYGSGLTEEDIEDINNRGMSKLDGELSRKLLVCREIAAEITDILNDRITNPPKEKLIDTLPVALNSLHNLNASDVSRSIGDCEKFSDEALNSLKDKLKKEGDIVQVLLLEKVGQYEPLEKKLSDLEKKYDELFPPVFPRQTYSSGPGFTELPESPPKPKPKTPEIDFKAYGDQLEKNPKLKSVSDKILKFYESKDQNPANIVFNLKSPYTVEELDKSARLLGRDCHPDKFPDNAQLAEEIFKEMQRLANIAKDRIR